MNFEIINEECVTKTEVKELLKKRTNLEFEQKMTKEHVKDAKLTIAKVSGMKKELEELKLTKLKQYLIVKIIDILPADEEELKMIFSMEIVPFNDEEVKKIMEVVKKYLAHAKE